MPKKVGQENSCTAVGTGQGGLCLVKDSCQRSTGYGQALNNCQTMCQHGSLLPRWEDGGRYNLSGILGHVPILREKARWS